MDNESINIGGYDDNAFKDRNGIRFLEGMLEQYQTIITSFERGGTVPNTDGYFELLSKQPKKNVPIARFTVQIKCTSGTISADGQFDYDCDTKILNYAKAQVTLEPIVLFVVVNESTVYYKYVSQEYIRCLNVNAQQQKRIKFTIADQLTDLNEFYRSMHNYHTKKKNALLQVIDPIPPEQCRLLQLEVDRLNDILNRQLSFIKHSLFPDIWKFGLSCQQNDNQLVVTFYAIRYGSNSELIMCNDIENIKEHPYVCRFYTHDTSINNIVDQYIADLIKTYAQRGYIPAYSLPTIVLEEIAFMFLDVAVQKGYSDDKTQRTELATKEEISINAIQHYWDALIESACYWFDLLQINPDEDAEYVIDPHHDLCVSKDARERFVQLVQSDHITRHQHRLRIQGHFPYGLVQDAINELHNRNVVTLHRPWPVYDYQAEHQERQTYKTETGITVEGPYSGYDLSTYKQIINRALSELADAYGFLSQKLFPPKSEMVHLTGRYSTAVPSSLNDQYYSAYQPANIFEIRVIDYDHLKRIHENWIHDTEKVYQSISCSMRAPIGKDGLIIYYQLWYLLFKTLNINKFSADILPHTSDKPIRLI